MTQFMIQLSNAGRTSTKQTGADHVQNRETLIRMLKNAFCEEMNAWYQYLIITPFIKGNERSEIQRKLEQQAKDEYEDHAMWLLERINRLGGTPEDILSPNDWNNIATHKYIMPSSEFTVQTAIEQNIEAEKGAIETYIALEKFTRDLDPVSNQKIIEILADEEEHLQTLLEFKEDLNY